MSATIRSPLKKAGYSVYTPEKPRGWDNFLTLGTRSKEQSLDNVWYERNDTLTESSGYSVYNQTVSDKLRGTEFPRVDTEWG